MAYKCPYDNDKCKGYCPRCDTSNNRWHDPEWVRSYLIARGDNDPDD